MHSKVPTSPHKFTQSVVLVLSLCDTVYTTSLYKESRQHTKIVKDKMTDMFSVFHTICMVTCVYYCIYCSYPVYFILHVCMCEYDTYIKLLLTYLLTYLLT